MSKRLRHGRRTVHPARAPTGRRRPSEGPADGPGRDRRVLLLAALVITLVAVGAAVAIHVLYRDDGGAPPGPEDWLATHIPVHTVGIGADDWWDVRPDISPDAGTPVDHPSWVLERLSIGPVIILDHSTGCAPCEAQTRDLGTVLARYPGQVTCLDVLADGSDQRAYDAFDAYDVNGGQHYIPLTVIVTRVSDGSGSRIVWHSSEGATGAEWLDIYLRDAIYYDSKCREGSA